jgi:hypothetical protein
VTRRLVGEDPLDLGRGQARTLPEQAVVLPLVLAAACGGDGEDHQLGLPSLERTEGHEATGEVQPAGEQPLGPPERGEDGRRFGAGDPAGGPGEAPPHRSQLAQVTRRDPGGHRAFLDVVGWAVV